MSLTPGQQREREKLEARGDRQVNRGNVLKALQYYKRAQVREKVLSVARSLLGDLDAIQEAPRLQKEIAGRVISAYEAVDAKDELGRLAEYSWENGRVTIALDALEAAGDDYSLLQRSEVLLFENKLDLALKGLEKYLRVLPQDRYNNLEADSLRHLVAEACDRGMQVIRDSANGDATHNLKYIIALLEMIDDFERLMDVGREVEERSWGMFYVNAYAGALNASDRQNIVVSDSILLKLARMFEQVGEKQLCIDAYKRCGATDELVRLARAQLSNGELANALELIPVIARANPKVLPKLRPELERLRDRYEWRKHAGRQKERKRAAQLFEHINTLLIHLYGNE